MNGPSVSQLIPILQTAIGPVILISGVGLLLLSMTNRLGRIVDRSRTLGSELASGPSEQRAKIETQVRILLRRAVYVRRAIRYATVSVLLAALLIIVIFFTAVFSLDDAWLIAALFILCLASLILSLLAFLRDINLSLAALRTELGEVTPES